jgi:hypothetical protein
MNELDQRIQGLPGAATAPDAGVKSAARERLVRLTRDARRVPPSRRLRKRTWIGSTIVTVAAAVVVVVLTVSMPETGSNGERYVATSELGRMLMQSANAEPAPQDITNTWYQRSRHEMYWTPNTSTKYGTRTETKRLETTEEWQHRDGASRILIRDEAGEQVYPSARQNANEYSRDAWKRTMGLSTDLPSLRAAYLAHATQEFESLHGDKSDPEESITQIVVQSLVDDLSTRPMSRSVRCTALAHLAELADKGFLVDRGIVRDAKGQEGRSFAMHFQDSESGDLIYVFEPNTGQFLQHDMLIDGQLFDRWIYEASGFVDSENDRR